MTPNRAKLGIDSGWNTEEVTRKDHNKVHILNEISPGTIAYTLRLPSSKRKAIAREKTDSMRISTTHLFLTTVQTGMAVKQLVNAAPNKVTPTMENL